MVRRSAQGSWLRVRLPSGTTFSSLSSSSKITKTICRYAASRTSQPFTNCCSSANSLRSQHVQSVLSLWCCMPSLVPHGGHSRLQEYQSATCTMQVLTFACRAVTDRGGGINGGGFSDMGRLGALAAAAAGHARGAPCYCAAMAEGRQAAALGRPGGAARALLLFHGPEEEAAACAAWRSRLQRQPQHPRAGIQDAGAPQSLQPAPMVQGQTAGVMLPVGNWKRQIFVHPMPPYHARLGSSWCGRSVWVLLNEVPRTYCGGAT